MQYFTLPVCGHRAIKRNIFQWRLNLHAVPYDRSRGQLVHLERRIGNRIWRSPRIRRFRFHCHCRYCRSCIRYCCCLIASTSCCWLLGRHRSSTVLVGSCWHAGYRNYCSLERMEFHMRSMVVRSWSLAVEPMGLRSLNLAAELVDRSWSLAVELELNTGFVVAVAERAGHIGIVVAVELEGRSLILAEKQS